MLVKIILSVLALQVFCLAIYDLKKVTHSGFRRSMDWSVFFLSYVSIVTCYFWCFFPQVRFWGTADIADWEARVLIFGQTTIGIFAIIGFWLCMILSTVDGDPLYSDGQPVFIRKYIAPVSIIMLLICLPFFSILQWTKVQIVNNSVATQTDLPAKNTVHSDTEPVTVVNTASENSVIPVGGSLCGSLKMTSIEALLFAKKYRMTYWYGKKKWLYVLIKPGDTFHIINGKWEPVK